MMVVVSNDGSMLTFYLSRQEFTKLTCLLFHFDKTYLN